MKVPIEEQIAEVEREIRQRMRRYPDAVARGRLREDTAARKLHHMTAAALSLRWLATNEHWIKPIAEERRRMATENDLAGWKTHRDVAPLIEAFPGAEVVAVTRTDEAAA